MSKKNGLELQQSHGAPDMSGCWALMPGRAVSLLPREAGVLCIAQGRAWVTQDGPHRGAGNASGDHFLRAGEQWQVEAGRHLVLEPWNDSSGLPVYFDWSPVAALDAVPAMRWNLAVVQPLRDLGLALQMAASALGRLMAGLVGYGGYRMAGRGPGGPGLPKLEPSPPCCRSGV